MAHIAIVGGGIGGLPTAYELRHLLPREHQVTLVSDRSKFTFIPSLPWVAFDMTPLENVQLEIEPLLKWRGIDWVDGKVTHLDPEAKTLVAGDRTLNYDYLVIATGASLNTDAIPGLGPDNGYTHSVCNPHHAEMAREAWLKFEENPGPLVVGAVPGASCMGPAYEFALLADYVLRKRGLRDRVPITFITPEPYAGQLGIGGMANSGKLVTELFKMKQIEWVENAAVTEISPEDVCLSDGRRFPFKYSMLLPPFVGAQFLRDVPGLTDAKGFVPVLPTYRHPELPSIYTVGIASQLAPPEKTAVPLGVPKTGQMTESMGMAVAHNIARDLGVIKSAPVKPALEAICMADFGDTGIIFIAQPVVPDNKTRTRRRSIAKRGIWVSWIKIAFERFFMAKMQNGLGVPWFEKLGLNLLGIRLVEPLSEAERLEEMTHGSGSRPSGSRFGVAREPLQNS
ncbi:NAD(P)/FAD-dependent oxidoreductase [Baaleninema simplex]|uniref:NAD(P)/FAD-dependent oxidoreductase n=1 Tax=Baaleninema simplex TaxID=2862350 RepID=UPI000348A089|nr:FAD/NAD(P)-binding oxidoreductase [Baaleninema simplex]